MRKKLSEVCQCRNCMREKMEFWLTLMAGRVEKAEYRQFIKYELLQLQIARQ